VTAPAVVGIDIGGTKISLCAAGPSGEVLAVQKIAPGSEDGAAAVVDRFTTAAAALVDEVESRCGVRVRGVGVVSPGVVQPDGVQLAPNNLGWEDVPLVATLRERLALDAVEADNDAKGATAAEARWGALAGVSDGILLNLGTGFSAGAICGGALVRGAHGAALEIAYQIPSDGPLRGFGDGRAPLEEIFSGAGLQAAASDLLGRPTDTAEVFRAIAAIRGRKAEPGPTGDTGRLAALGERALDVAARAVANLAVALDPEVLALSGGMLSSADVIVPLFTATLARLVPFPPRLVMARFAGHAPLAGACLLAYRAAAIPPPDDLAIDGQRPSGKPVATEEQP
jgi:glucokinase